MSMTAHDRFQAFMRFQPVDRPPLQEWGPWLATLRLWTEETGKSREYCLSYLRECDAEEWTGLEFGMIPPFPERVVAEDDTTITRQDRMGKTFRLFKADPDASMPEYLDSPVKTRGDWEAVKARLNPDTPGRYPADWEQRLVRWRRDRSVLRQYSATGPYYGGPSLYGFVRMLVGEEQALYLFHDAPALVHDMMDTATDFFVRVLTKSLREAPVTFVQFWEDMCFRGGPLISPASMSAACWRGRPSPS